MRALYIFPHPDDESFGPAPAMAGQLRSGHEVFLLTYTRGGATRIRHDYGLSVDEMGAVRLDEMKAVEKVLGLSGMEVLDLPDSGLKHMNPIELEEITEQHIRKVKPDVVVSYPVHGVSGFQDHLVTHAIVKRVFCKLRDEWEGAPRRLAFFTLAESDKKDRKFQLNTSSQDEIDCATPLSKSDLELGKRALDCYKTYQEVINEVGVMERIGDTVFFEFFQESFRTHLKSLFDRLP
ncbi:PIG-L family deacetylase [Balneolales bacterium ANBcel1]|nr:PIG-L family deacetylase [Balneolales bacterium ANBcel1]